MQPLVSLEWATEYFITSRPKSDEWDAADDVERQQYLGWASERIKSAFKFNADVDIYDNDRVRAATCVQALYLMQTPAEYPDVLTKGIVSASAGVVSATFSKDFVAPLICEEAKLLIGELGNTIGSMAVITTMPLGGIFSNG